MKKIVVIAMLMGAALLTAACAGQPEPEAEAKVEVKDVTMMLDWTPNTNHTGFYVAQAKGWYDEAGLNVSIIEPGESFVESAVSTQAAQFGISYQEGATFSMVEGVDIVSVAAVIQHNTSGFASRSSAGISSAADFDGKRYGSFGSPIEQPIINLLMECEGVSADGVEFIDTGFADFLAITEADEVDFAWIFYAWTGISAEQQGVDLDVVMLKDHLDCVPDYYTPILVTSNALIGDDPEMVEAFVQATARGYEFAIENPSEAADILLEAVPELDAELVRESQDWLANEYQADAAKWGMQQEAVWQNFADFLIEANVLEGEFDASAAYTNRFLGE